MTRLPQRFWSRVELVAGSTVAPAQVTAVDLRDKVMALRGNDR